MAKRIQWLIAAVFFVLGGWALVHPHSVIELCFLPEFRDGAALSFMVGCFGAQALIAGTFAATAVFTRQSFIAFAWMLVGFVAFDLWFTFIDPVLTVLGGVVDAVGNLTMISACIVGARQCE